MGQLLRIDHACAIWHVRAGDGIQSAHQSPREEFVRRRWSCRQGASQDCGHAIQVSAMAGPRGATPYYTILSIHTSDLRDIPLILLECDFLFYLTPECLQST